MAAKFDADAAQHKQPQHHSEWKIKPAETGGVQQRKCEVERASSSEQPDFVAVPYRPNRAQNCATLSIVFGDEEMDRTGPDIEAVEQDVHGDHYRDDHEPNRWHGYRTSTGLRRPDIGGSGGPTGSGPCSISRRTRNKKRNESKVYIPANPRNVNQPLPADTILEKPSSVRISP